MIPTETTTAGLLAEQAPVILGDIARLLEPFPSFPLPLSTAIILMRVVYLLFTIPPTGVLLPQTYITPA